MTTSHQAPLAAGNAISQRNNARARAPQGDVTGSGSMRWWRASCSARHVIALRTEPPWVAQHSDIGVAMGA